MTEKDGGEAGEKDELDARADAQTSPADGPLPVRRKSARRRVFFSILRLFVIVGLIAAGLSYLVERGSLDGVITRKAQVILNNAVGVENYSARIEKATMRFNARGQIVFNIANASLQSTRSPGKALETGHIQIALEMLPLIIGDIKVSSIDIDGAGVNLDAFQSTEMKGKPFRIDSIPGMLRSAYKGIEDVKAAARRAGAAELRVSGLSFQIDGTQGAKVPVKVGAVSFKLAQNDTLSISGHMTVDGTPATVDAVAKGAAGEAGNLSLVVNGFNLKPFTTLRSRKNKAWIGLSGRAKLAIEARAGKDATPDTLRFDVELEKSAFYGEGEASQVSAGRVAGHYDFRAEKIEFEPSVLAFGDTRIPFTGGLIDADRLDKKDQAKTGVAIDLLIQGGHAAPANLGDRPVDFQGKAFGTFNTHTGLLSVPDILIASNAGVLGGSLSVNFASVPGPGMPGDSPEISLGLFTQKIGANAIRALWPFWLGPQARDWVYGNLFGGTISNGSLALFLPAGLLPFYPEDPVKLNDRELKIRFDIEKARVSIAGDIPPMRDTVAHFELAGPKITTDIKSATAYFPSGRTVDLADGHFEIADVDKVPTMADAQFKLQGSADSLAELATYRPIEALQRTGFKPGDFSGKASVSLKVRFPLEGNTKVTTSWVADLDLTDIAINTPIGGRKISGVNGHMSINPLSASLEADVSADGVPLHMSLVEPLSPDSRQKRRKHVTASLDSAMLAKLMPGLDDVISGNVALEMDLLNENRLSIQADLTKATVSIPGVGWQKGTGVAAKAHLISQQDGDTYKISDFTFSGDGFGISGDLEADKSGLQTGRFSKVQLAPGDDMAVTLTRSGNGYRVAINGKAADIRGALNAFKAARAGGDSSDIDLSINAKLDTVKGFNNETLKNVDAVFATRNGVPSAVKLTAVTSAKQAVVAKLSPDLGGKRTIELTATDAGAFARFAGVYEKMVGGLLNVTFRHVGKSSWSGVADIRNFRILNEDKLQQIVSTPAGASGKSLNDAVKRNIDVSSQKFSRGYARILINGNVTSIENGVVRGEQVGATFQGVLRDGDDNMNMTGTFMPAYGLNRLFASVPILGLFLGNGRDQGLIGITFRLSGNYQAPKLTINPLSIIAPGIFRNIFQFH